MVAKRTSEESGIKLEEDVDEIKRLCMKLDDTDDDNDSYDDNESDLFDSDDDSDDDNDDD